MTFGATEQRTAEYVRHGTTNLFPSLNVSTGEVFGLCSSTRDGAEVRGFLKKAVKPHAGKCPDAINCSGYVDPRLAQLL